MLLEDAVELIRNEKLVKPGIQVWADLGCGSGTFTKALAEFLPPGSIIYAADKNKSALEKIPDVFRGVSIKKLHGDFLKIEIPFDLDGIVLANSIHFVKDKEPFLKKIQNLLKNKGLLLIVEYDMDSANQWVPFPMSFQSLKLYFNNQKNISVLKLGELPSVYQRDNIYSALIENPADK